MRQLSAIDARRGEEVYALTNHDNDGPCVIMWEAPDVPADETLQCDGWIAGDRLFAPSDGTDPPGTNIEGGLPTGRWYDVASGRPALKGVGGAPLAVLL
jgi:hypothetical protein